jgi:serine/threonine protein phosphatase PrpC
MSAGTAPRDREDLARRLVRAVEVAGLRIFSEAKADRNRRGMGTTATAAALVDEYLFLAQVGDSRAYLLRGEQLQLVTRDQSLVNQLIEAGQLTEEEAENFEHSNIILQALGTADSVQVDLTYVKLKAGDTLLLCSDGLSGMVRGEEIRQALLANPEPIDVCKVLTDKANEAGGHDNITVIVAKFDNAPAPQPSDDPLKYQKYVFQTEDSTFQSAEQVVANGGAAPTSQRGNSESPPRASQPAPAQGKLARTAIGLNAAELMAQMKQSEQTPATGASVALAGTPAAGGAPQAAGGPVRVSTEAEMATAGIPSPGIPSWVILLALLAIGIVAVGVWVLRQ